MNPAKGSNPAETSCLYLLWSGMYRTDGSINNACPNVLALQQHVKNMPIVKTIKIIDTMIVTTDKASFGPALS